MFVFILFLCAYSHFISLSLSLSLGKKQTNKQTQMLDFGRVCVNSQTARNFALTNPLTQFIIVEIRISDPELKLSKPLTQVIPPGETAGFDILLSSPVVQLFKRNVYYVINEQHTYHFSCSADIVAISLGVSADDLQFRFSAENDSFAATQTVSLSNPFSIPVRVLVYLFIYLLLVFYFVKQACCFALLELNLTCFVLGTFSD